MKNLIYLILLILSIGVTSCATTKPHKHPSHKKAKVKKSKYYFNFQH